MLIDDSEAPYALKFRRAQQHLEELNTLLRPYKEGNPYVPIRDREAYPNPRIWAYRAHLAEEVSPFVPILVGDVIGNLRSCLDHLMAALVPANRKRKAKWPIVRENIFRPDPETGQPQDRFADEVASYLSATQGINPDAERLVYDLQPFRQGYDVKENPLTVLSALDNAHKHYELVRVEYGIKDPTVILTCSSADIRLSHEGQGSIERGGVVATFYIRPRDLNAHGIDPDARERILSALASGQAEVDVQLTGTPLVFFRIPELQGQLAPIPETLEPIFDTIYWRILNPLYPFTREAF